VPVAFSNITHSLLFFILIVPPGSGQYSDAFHRLDGVQYGAHPRYLFKYWNIKGITNASVGINGRIPQLWLLLSNQLPKGGDKFSGFSGLYTIGFRPWQQVSI
jgi:hypothetical protein